MAYELFIEKFSLVIQAPMPMDWWYDYFDDDGDTEDDET